MVPWMTPNCLLFLLHSYMMLYCDNTFYSVKNGYQMLPVKSWCKYRCSGNSFSLSNTKYYALIPVLLLGTWNLVNGSCLQRVQDRILSEGPRGNTPSHPEAPGFEELQPLPVLSKIQYRMLWHMLWYVHFSGCKHCTLHLNPHMVIQKNTDRCKILYITRTCTIGCIWYSAS